MTKDEWRYLKDLRECVNYYRSVNNKTALEKDTRAYREAMYGALVKC